MKSLFTLSYQCYSDRLTAQCNGEMQRFVKETVGYGLLQWGWVTRLSPEVQL